MLEPGQKKPPTIHPVRTAYLSAIAILGLFSRAQNMMAFTEVRTGGKKCGISFQCLSGCIAEGEYFIAPNMYIERTQFCPRFDFLLVFGREY